MHHTTIQNAMHFGDGSAIRLEEGNWIIMEDMNTVEHPAITYGPSPLIHGVEEPLWKRMSRERDLVDAFMVAADRQGPAFTRYQVKHDRIEMARLERIYFNNSGDWIDTILTLR
ncbi:hypothetical protein R1flu_010018 [Riccia fluitans]|uniref:Uncharacterized protein n=1 Tax=Riccia fluitans TaxID=41844 RepID=A0ABD1Z3T4_9MARC